MSDYVTGTGQTLRNIHDQDACAGACPIHKPSEHHMRDWPTAWIDGRMWRRCEHDLYHPDPDSVKRLAPFDIFLYREGVASVSLSHATSCGCMVCVAATGDEMALEQVMIEATEGHARKPCDGCCDPRATP